MGGAAVMMRAGNSQSGIRRLAVDGHALAPLDADLPELI
jgi:hypothetical protein